MGADDVDQDMFCLSDLAQNLCVPAWLTIAIDGRWKIDNRFYSGMTEKLLFIKIIANRELKELHVHLAVKKLCNLGGTGCGFVDMLSQNC